MTAIMYRYPKLYNLAVRIIHGKSLKKRYEVIAEEIGENKKVFELGSGTALVYTFLHKGCEYLGWDLNERFLRFCRKRGLKVVKKNIFDFEDYPDSDVVLICDVLHHLVPNHEMLLVEALKRSKKLIVSEPAIFSKPSEIFKPIAVFFNYFLGDYDGINRPQSQLEWDYNEEKLRAFFQRLGCTRTIKVGWDMIAVFDSPDA